MKLNIVTVPRVEKVYDLDNHNYRFLLTWEQLDWDGNAIRMSRELDQDQVSRVIQAAGPHEYEDLLQDAKMRWTHG